MDRIIEALPSGNALQMAIKMFGADCMTLAETVKSQNEKKLLSITLHNILSCPEMKCVYMKLCSLFNS